MTSFNEGTINRDADGKFAAKTTGETDAAALDSGQDSFYDQFNAGVEASKKREASVNERARNFAEEAGKFGSPSQADNIERLSADRQTVAYARFMSKSDGTGGSFRKAAREARKLDDASARRLATEYRRGSMEDITSLDINESSKRGLGERLRSRFIGDRNANDWPRRA